jgi:isopenicillin-N epimerase
MNRRSFLVGALLAGAVPGLARRALAAETDVGGDVGEEGSWSAVRDLFDLRDDRVHLASLFLASHPRPVREAIERHRRELDRDPTSYLLENGTGLRIEVLAAAAEYFGASSYGIALTDSTTMGLALLYNGIQLEPGDEIVTTDRDYYSTRESLRYRAARSGATVRTVELGRPAEASEDSLVEALSGDLGRRTRVLALTWIHSDTGLKLPLRGIAEAVARINAGRDERERILVCVDGVHGFGVEDVTLGDLGCDFFVAGCHKWLFGPRGTGVVYAARPALWDRVQATIPPFGAQHTPGLLHTPGGFHSFEHRWALAEAFRLHLQIGKHRIAARTRALAQQLKEELAAIGGVVLHTPMSTRLSAGIVSFDIDGLGAAGAVERLRERGLVVTQAPYGPRSIRATPSIVNTPEEIDRLVRAVHELA